FANSFTETPSENNSPLHVLTTKFVGILQEAEDGVMDLREAVRILNVSQKRRIYDITNVLEGVGLVRKMSKSMIKWMGALQGEDEYELEKRKMELKSELEDLEQKEFILDQHKLWGEQSIRNTKEDSTLTYVNHEDICSCFTGHTLLVVRAPPGTQMDVPIPKDSPAKYQIHLKSVKGPIDVVLLNKHSVSSAPVVLPVPPPEEILQRAQLAMSASNEKEMLAARSVFVFYYFLHVHTIKSSPLILLALSAFTLSSTPCVSIFFHHVCLCSSVFSPLLHLSAPPSDHDYSCNLDDSEGVCDLFDVPMLNV
uniref:E2F transcription factor 4 n=1 Tax=Acanthochromis polyacanthus TaxID=80966 RepID=A0A3Q1EZ95_9TELE